LCFQYSVGWIHLEGILVVSIPIRNNDAAQQDPEESGNFGGALDLFPQNVQYTAVSIAHVQSPELDEITCFSAIRKAIQCQ